MRISQRIILGLSIFTAFLIALIVYFHVGLSRIDKAAVRLQAEWVELQQMETLLDLLRRLERRLVERTGAAQAELKSIRQIIADLEVPGRGQAGSDEEHELREENIRRTIASGCAEIARLIRPLAEGTEITENDRTAALHEISQIHNQFAEFVESTLR